MIVLEFKAQGKTTQYKAIDEAIRTAQFVPNKCLRYWMDNRGIGPKELYRHNKALRALYPFVKALNSHACQVAVEWADSAIARFYENCRKSIPGKKGYPKFKKNCRSVEYKTSGWSLSQTRKQITFTDKKGISMRTHICKCGFILDRDWNAALMILKVALSTVGIRSLGSKIRTLD